MKKTSTSNRGFTLIELLTVIAIIAVLAGLLFPAISAAMKKAKTTKASIEAHAIETAWTAYFNEYGQWPVVITGNTVQYLMSPGLNARVDVCHGLTTTNDTAALLLGTATPVGTFIGKYSSQANNPKLIQFCNLKPDPTTGAFLDPWGHTYKFLFDTTYANQIANSYLGTTTTPIPRKVIVWSDGPDGIDNNADDVKTWQ